MKKNLIIIVIVFFCSLIVISDSFSMDGLLKTEQVKEGEISGTFSLILYGSRHMEDVETVAILDKEGDDYTFEPFAPEFNYKIMKNVPAKEAFRTAIEFVSWHSSFRRVQLSRIFDYKGNTLGYELKPLYFPLTFGVSETIEVDYWVKGNKVIIRIKLLPSVEEKLRGGVNKEQD
jgi:hypothetical protein